MTYLIKNIISIKHTNKENSKIVHWHFRFIGITRYSRLIPCWKKDWHIIKNEYLITCLQICCHKSRLYSKYNVQMYTYYILIILLMYSVNLKHLSACARLTTHYSILSVLPLLVHKLNVKLTYVIIINC